MDTVAGIDLGNRLSFVAHRDDRDLFKIEHELVLGICIGLIVERDCEVGVAIKRSTLQSQQ